MSENPEEKLHSLTTEDAFHRFSLADIHLATQNFDDDLVIGKGGFGKVYKGRIHGTRDATERLVAIKRLDSSSTQGAPEFMNEIKMLTKVHHCNLVSLIGYCFDNNEMILVYEYMPNGTVDYHLHKADTRLSWMHRLKISIGVARGLHYLHTGVGTQHGIIHRDLKSSNILLDENWAARISDFGMSKVVDHPSSGVITTPKGTFGYLDHEYCRTGKLTRKSDVYAFGVFLFELLSGRRAVDPLFVDEGHNVADWAKKCVKEGQLEQVVSSHITKQISPKCLKEFVHIADLCTKSSRKERPTMAEVVYTLDQLMALQKKFDSSGSRHNSDSLRIFSYSDMEVATKNFSSHRLLGRGHCGEVFRGWLDKKTHSSYIHDNGLSIAVKRLYRHKFKSHMVNEMKMESLEEFNDPNVVKILGYCVEEYSVLIIYEFMHQGNLKDYLFNVKRRTEQHLFASRVKIAIGVARGLLFLRTQPQLADCSLLMHNILLDEEFNAKLSDFDVAMLAPSCAVPSYLHPSPSYYLKERSGVFGFGLLLMELLTGKPISSKNDLNIVRRKWMLNVCGALDSRIFLNFLQRKLAVQLVVLAKRCVADELYLRPTLESILEELEEIFVIMSKSYNIDRGDDLSTHIRSRTSL